MTGDDREIGTNEQRTAGEVIQLAFFRAGRAARAGRVRFGGDSDAAPFSAISSSA